MSVLFIFPGKIANAVAFIEKPGSLLNNFTYTFTRQLTIK